jgi:hypothetical protein
MDQLRGAGGSGTGEVLALDQGDVQAAHRGVARDRGAVDSAADDREIEAFAGKPNDLLAAVQWRYSSSANRLFPRCKRGARQLGRSACASGAANSEMIGEALLKALE